MSKNSILKTPPSQESKTDWKRVDDMRDEDIDLSEIPEVTPEQFARAIARKGLKSISRKKQITLRLDAEVLEWFKQQGPGYQTQINTLLREYMKAHQSKRSRR